MNAGEQGTDTSLFHQEVKAWLTTLPVTLQEIPADPPEFCFLKIKNKKGQSLDLQLRTISQTHKTTPFSLAEETTTRKVLLWEDLWRTKPAIVQSRLKALLGMSERIPARLTQVRRLNRPTTKRFLQENHLQAATLSKYNYGLFLPRQYFRILDNPPQADELLVAVATFARPRVFLRESGPHRSFELVRFANLLDTTVVGGLDKLLSHFEKEHQPDDLMTYADLEWSSGRSYRKLGFEPKDDTPPQEFWVNPATMERFYPHRLPEGITTENARKRGFVKIKNDGSRKFVKIFHPQTPSS